jgi:AraC-like DNA-binding protein
MSADPLSDVLRTVRLTGGLFFLVDASPPWVVEVPVAESFRPLLLPDAQHMISYHVVTQGSCWAALTDGGSPVRLEAGDVVLFPHGDAYVMSSAPGMRAKEPVEAALEFFREMTTTGAPAIALEAPGPDGTRVCCGYLGCDVRPFNPVLAAMPPLVHLRPPVGGQADRLGPLVQFALAESREVTAGGRCVLLRVGELMFVEVVRRYLLSLPSEQTGWLAGLRDPVVGHALALLHGDPAQGWTLERLAREVGISRSALADRFAHFVGQPPMQYLARWRMQIASRMLADGAAKVGAVALNVGYESEAAFSRAFKKIVGASPAAWRSRASDGTSAGGRGAAAAGR